MFFKPKKNKRLTDYKRHWTDKHDPNCAFIELKNIRDQKTGNLTSKVQMVTVNTSGEIISAGRIYLLKEYKKIDFLGQNALVAAEKELQPFPKNLI